MMTRNKHAVFLFLGLFFAVLPYCFFGFDITDYGYNLYEQKQSFHAGLRFLLTDLQTPLSNYLGGLFQQLSITGSLVESKLQGLLLYCICTLVVLNIIDALGLTGDNRKKIKTSIVIFCFSLIALNPFKSGSILIPSYDTFPILFCLLLTLILLEFLKTENLIFLLGGYILLFAIILLKISLLLVLALFGIVLAISIFRKRKHVYLQSILLILVGIGFIFYAKYFQTGNSVELSDSYDSYSLFRTYFNDLLKIPLPLVCLIGLIVVGYWMERKPSLKTYFSYVLIALGIILALKYRHFSYQSPDYKFLYKYKHMFSFSLCFFLMGVSTLLLWKKKPNANIIFVLLAAILLPCFLNFGTNNGLQKMGFGIVLMSAVIYVFIYDQENIFASIFYKVSILIGFIALLNLYTSYYRDSANPFRLNTTFNHSKLKFLHTTSEREKAYDEVLIAAKDFVSPGDPLLAYDYNPMIYWLTDTVAIQNLSWPHLFTLKQITEKASQICISRENTPRTIIKTLAAPFNKEWPVNHQDLSGPDQDKFNILDENVMENCKPEKKWFNDSFEIWIPTVIW